MNNVWLWVTLGVIVLIVVAATLLYTAKPVQPATSTSVQVTGTNTEANVANEVNVELPEVNEELVDVNIPPEI